MLFAFRRINHCWWATIHYKERLNLKVFYLTIYNVFTKEDFVVHHTYRNGSAVAIDQAPEKAYYKPAKGPRGIIGITGKKESVAKWNLIKHEKLTITSVLSLTSLHTLGN